MQFDGAPAAHVYAVTADTANDIIYVGGTFQNVDNMFTNNVVSQVGTGYVKLGLGPTNGVDSTVTALTMHNGELYLGGSFITGLGDTLNHVARWDGSSFHPLGTGIAGPTVQVNALKSYNGNLYAAGMFTSADGVPVNNIAKWDGANWSPVGTGIGATLVRAMEVYDNQLYVGGAFSDAGGIPVNNMAIWNDTSWSAFSTGANSLVNAFAEYNNDLYIGGSFSNIGGQPIDHLARWDGNSFTAVGGSPNSSIYSLTSYHCELYAGGTFDSIAGISVDNIARWNGTAWSELQFDLNAGNYWSMVTHAGKLYVGGSVYSFAGSFLKWNAPIPAPQTTSFTSSDTIVEAGSYVQFTNTTTNVTAQWSFPGGIPSTSNALNPLVQYPANGTYDVTLITTSCFGNDTLVVTNYIDVVDSMPVIADSVTEEFIQIVLHDSNTVFYSGNGIYNLHFYKASTYDPATSPILMFIHGTGGTGAASSYLYDMAERQRALIVAPTMHSTWAYVGETIQDTVTGCYKKLWLTEVLKQVYQHVSDRENRDSIPVHLTGYSQGGQFVTRYMFIRQFSPDSIPIVMAVSTNPANYTFMTDTLFGDSLNFEPYKCGIGGTYSVAYGCAQAETIPTSELFCEAHIKQYYNENYAVLCGDADITVFSGFCPWAQGQNRFDRSKRFYHFSDSNAVNRGTTLQWLLDSVPGAAHDPVAVYQTKRNPTDSFTIAETLLFLTPWHPVPSFLPEANFVADTTVVYVPNAMVQFTNLSTTGNYLWEFGDGDSSTVTDPSHLYTDPGIYTVTLTVYDGTCSPATHQMTIEVLLNIGLDDNEVLKAGFAVAPNPFAGEATIRYHVGEFAGSAELMITDLTGKLVHLHSIRNAGSGQFVFQANNNASAAYLCHLVIDGRIVQSQKLITISRR